MHSDGAVHWLIASWLTVSAFWWEGSLIDCKLTYLNSDGGSLFDCELTYPHSDGDHRLIASCLIRILMWGSLIDCKLSYPHSDRGVPWLIVSCLIRIMMGGSTDWFQAVLSAFWWLGSLIDCKQSYPHIDGGSLIDCKLLFRILIGGFTDWLQAVLIAFWWEGSLIGCQLTYPHSDGMVQWLIAICLIRILMWVHWLIASWLVHILIWGRFTDWWAADWWLCPRWCWWAPTVPAWRRRRRATSRLSTFSSTPWMWLPTRRPSSSWSASIAGCSRRGGTGCNSCLAAARSTWKGRTAALPAASSRWYL